MALDVIDYRTSYEAGDYNTMYYQTGNPLGVVIVDEGGTPADGVGVAPVTPWGNAMTRYYLENGDPLAAAGHRSEHSASGSTFNFTSGQHSFHRFGMYIPSAWAINRTSGFIILYQVHEGAGSPILSIHMTGSDLNLTMRRKVTSNPQSFNDTALGAIEFNTWYSFGLEVFLSSTTSGFWKMYRETTPNSGTWNLLAEQTGVRTLVAGSINYHKQGFYTGDSSLTAYRYGDKWAAGWSSNSAYTWADAIAELDGTGGTPAPDPDPAPPTGSVVLTIAGDLDDAYVDGDGANFVASQTTSGIQKVISDSSGTAARQNVGLRFTDSASALPAGATITSAIPNWWVDSTFRDDFTGTLWFEKTASAAAMNATTRRPYSGDLTPTSATVSISATATGTGFYDGPDVTTPLQEVIDEGWAPGNSLLLVVEGGTSGTGLDGTIDSYGADPTHAATLTIEYITSDAQTLTPTPAVITMTVPSISTTFGLVLTPTPAVITMAVPDPTLSFATRTLTPDPAVITMNVPSVTVRSTLFASDRVNVSIDGGPGGSTTVTISL